MRHTLEQPSFGRRLKELRLARGLSQATLGGQEISTGYLSRLESGARPPTERIVTYLAKQLEVPVSAFEEPTTGSLAGVLATVTSSPDDDVAAELLADAIATDDGRNPALRWQALWLLARIKTQRGQYNEEFEHLQELTSISDELGNPEMRARARTQAARCMRALGNTDDAYTCAIDAFHIAQQHQLSVHDTATALLVLVSTEAETGRLPDARAHADDLCALVGDASGALPVEALWTAAAVRTRQGDHAAAQDFLEQALRRLDSRDDLMLWMRLRLAAASLYLQVDPPRTDIARLRLQEAETALELIGTPLQRQELLVLQAHLAFHEGRTADASKLCEKLREDDLRLSFRDRVRLDVLRSQLLVLDGKPEEGIRTLQDLARRANDSLNVDLAAEVWRTLAETLAQLHSSAVIAD
ncbi:helix-turn-helix domain-containing protein [Streptomyces sp. NEAU-Y11]|uniref:helix-turn-helix domain-containing protein n=1 Tax=Streptomyces cucumeris TaxID=2962890 RepID=UPI0020C89136|nr:helix-turn-helix domain-containing protein [Streptomyces sp. NEAU-Y11]MCP9211501.1 helix-turn-helix domain-containing protein [Streptomyces sp. NEAU-Y11]